MRVYIKKGKKRLWDEKTLRLALENVQDKKISIAKAAELYNIPERTLRRRWRTVLNTVGGLNNLKLVKISGFKTTFSDEQENELVKRILESNKTSGFTRKDLRKLAFEYAERKKVFHNFNKRVGLAGADWCRNFMQRHPELILRASDNR